MRGLDANGLVFPRLMLLDLLLLLLLLCFGKVGTLLEYGKLLLLLLLRFLVDVFFVCGVGVIIGFVGVAPVVLPLLQNPPPPPPLDDDDDDDNVCFKSAILDAAECSSNNSPLPPLSPPLELSLALALVSS